MLLVERPAFAAQVTGGSIALETVALLLGTLALGFFLGRLSTRPRRGSAESAPTPPPRGYAQEGCAEGRDLPLEVMDALPCPIFFKDSAGLFIGGNRAFQACTGLSREELAGKNEFEIFPEQLAALNRQADLELIKSGGEQQYEGRLVSGGSVQELLFLRGVVQDATGRPAGIAGTFLDLTKNKEAEAKCRQQKEFSESLLQHSAVPTFALDRNHEVVVWNRACEELSGISAAEVIGTKRHWAAFYAEERPTLADLVIDGCREADRLYDIWQRSPLASGGVQGEAWLRNPSGKEGYFLFSAAPIRNRAGEVIAAIETVEEITERKKTEDQLRKLSWAVEQSSGIVVITDTGGRIEYVNRKFVEVTGYRSDEVMGRNPRLLKSGFMPPEIYADLWQTVLRGEEWRGELQNKKKNGDLYWEAATISPVKDDSGQVRHFVALLEDITEARALSNALMHAQKMEALGTLTGGVAHDFNNILTAIIGYANLIQIKLPPGDPSSGFAEKVVISAEKAASLTRSLLNYTRSQSINPASLDLNSVVGRVSKLISRVVGEGVQLTVAVGATPLIVFADSGQLEQLLMNLATNAAEAMSRRGSLSITTSDYVLDSSFVKRHGFGVAGRYALLRVADNGSGLDEKTRERIFEPFFTTQGTGGGPGLGLSIVYGIVKQHKGYIEVESVLGGGSTFSVYLPLLGAHEKSNPTCPPLS